MKNTINNSLVFTLFVIAFSLNLNGSAAGAAPSCSERNARAAEVESSSLQTWGAIFAHYSKFSGCDDGAIAEGYSSSIATLLTDHWDQTKDLAKLVRDHPDFKSLVLRHIDQTLGEAQEREIKAHLESACVPSTQSLCHAIKKRLKVLDSE
jgi:hypothetical protein